MNFVWQKQLSHQITCLYPVDCANNKRNHHDSAPSRLPQDISAKLESVVGLFPVTLFNLNRLRTVEFLLKNQDNDECSTKYSS